MKQRKIFTQVDNNYAHYPQERQNPPLREIIRAIYQTRVKQAARNSQKCAFPTCQLNVPS